MTRRNSPARVDTRGLKCPWPVLRAARAMRTHEAILLLADDPVARVDVPALAQTNGWTLEIDDQQSHIEYLIRQATDR